MNRKKKFKKGNYDVNTVKLIVETCILIGKTLLLAVPKACNSLPLLIKKTKRKNAAPLFTSAEVSKYYLKLINFG